MLSLVACPVHRAGTPKDAPTAAVLGVWHFLERPGTVAFIEFYRGQTYGSRSHFGWGAVHRLPARRCRCGGGKRAHPPLRRAPDRLELKGNDAQSVRTDAPQVLTFEQRRVGRPE